MERIDLKWSSSPPKWSMSPPVVAPWRRPWTWQLMSMESMWRRPLHPCIPFLLYIKRRRIIKGAKLLAPPNRPLPAPNRTSMPPDEPVSQNGLVHPQKGQFATKMTVRHQRCQMTSSRIKMLSAPKMGSMPLKTKNDWD